MIERKYKVAKIGNGTQDNPFRASVPSTVRMWGCIKAPLDTDTIWEVKAETTQEEHQKIIASGGIEII